MFNSVPGLITAVPKSTIMERALVGSVVHELLLASPGSALVLYLTVPVMPSVSHCDRSTDFRKPFHSLPSAFSRMSVTTS